MDRGRERGEEKGERRETTEEKKIEEGSGGEERVRWRKKEWDLSGGRDGAQTKQCDIKGRRGPRGGDGDR